MTSFNITATLTRKHTGEDFADEIHTELAAYHVASAADARQRAKIIITLEATNIRQAADIGAALLQKHQLVSLKVETTAEFDHPVPEIPRLFSVTEMAERLSVTRQAILQRIESGSLPARRVGKAWVIAG